MAGRLKIVWFSALFACVRGDWSLVRWLHGDDHWKPTGHPTPAGLQPMAFRPHWREDGDDLVRPTPADPKRATFGQSRVALEASFQINPLAPYLLSEIQPDMPWKSGDRPLVTVSVGKLDPETLPKQAMIDKYDARRFGEVLKIIFDWGWLEKNLVLREKMKEVIVLAGVTSELLSDRSAIHTDLLAYNACRANHSRDTRRQVLAQALSMPLPRTADHEIYAPVKFRDLMLDDMDIYRKAIQGNTTPAAISKDRLENLIKYHTEHFPPWMFYRLLVLTQGVGFGLRVIPDELMLSKTGHAINLMLAMLSQIDFATVKFQGNGVVRDVAVALADLVPCPTNNDNVRREITDKLEQIITTMRLHEALKTGYDDVEVAKEKSEELKQKVKMLLISLGHTELAAHFDEIFRKTVKEFTGSFAASWATHEIFSRLGAATVTLFPGFKVSLQSLASVVTSSSKFGALLGVGAGPVGCAVAAAGAAAVSLTVSLLTFLIVEFVLKKTESGRMLLQCAYQQLLRLQDAVHQNTPASLKSPYAYYLANTKKLFLRVAEISALQQIEPLDDDYEKSKGKLSELANVSGLVLLCRCCGCVLQFLEFEYAKDGFFEHQPPGDLRLCASCSVKPPSNIVYSEDGSSWTKASLTTVKLQKGDIVKFLKNVTSTWHKNNVPARMQFLLSDIPDEVQNVQGQYGRVVEEGFFSDYKIKLFHFNDSTRSLVPKFLETFAWLPPQDVVDDTVTCFQRR